MCKGCNLVLSSPEAVRGLIYIVKHSHESCLAKPLQAIKDQVCKWSISVNKLIKAIHFLAEYENRGETKLLHLK